MNNGKFENKTVLVTGGAAGIGKATALDFARQGAKVVIADLLAEEGETTAREIEALGGEALFVKTDVADAGEVKALIDKTVEKFGGLYAACNNAGIEGEAAATADCSESNWDKIIQVNLKGVWLCMKYEIPQMLEGGGGSIVNMSSVAGFVGFRGMPAYCASKGGIIQLTRTAALEYADSGIRVNAVCPGVIRTEMIERVTGNDPEKETGLTSLEPVGRMGTAEEVAAAVLWLCSDEASFVTGHPMTVDGGLVAQ